MNNGFDNENFQNNTQGTENTNSVPLSVDEIMNKLVTF